MYSNMVLLTVVTTSNPHTLYFDHPIEKAKLYPAPFCLFVQLVAYLEKRGSYIRRYS